jgi:hypothetical protein
MYIKPALYDLQPCLVTNAADADGLVDQPIRVKSARAAFIVIHFPMCRLRK